MFKVSFVMVVTMVVVVMLMVVVVVLVDVATITPIYIFITTTSVAYILLQSLHKVHLLLETNLFFILLISWSNFAQIQRFWTFLNSQEDELFKRLRKFERVMQ